MAKRKPGRERAPQTTTGKGRGRPPRGRTRQRKQLVVDVSLLEQAMQVTGRNQSETVNEALARLTENAAILQGVEQMRGAFPDHPDHGDDTG